MIDITILGTASMVPTRDRNVQAVLAEIKGEYILFDCGEGTQRQMNIAGFSRAKVKKIFITHWHGDHVGGLISLIQTIFNSEYQHTLHIYGPQGTTIRLEHLKQTVDFENQTDIEVHELNPEKEEIITAFENEDYKIECTPMKHGTPTLAYAIEEKERRRIDMAQAKKFNLKPGPLIGKLSRGLTVTHEGKEITPQMVTYTTDAKRFVMIPDTAPNNGIALLAESADILLCEATFTNDHEEKAHAFKHMTAANSAMFAQQAGVKRLILTHFSQRYPIVDKHLEEAQVHYPKVEAAHDFMKFTL